LSTTAPLAHSVRATDS